MIAVAFERHIVCPAGIFAGYEQTIQRLTAEINRTSAVADKAAAARELRDTTELLLACSQRQDGNINCRICQEFARLRSNTADLILRAAGLAS